MKKISAYFLFIAFVLGGAVSCRTVFGTSAPEPLSLSEVNDFLYQLQDADLDAIGRSRYDLVILDYSSDGSDAGKWNASRIENLKKAGEGRLVLAYVSIGEAEDYRFYWDPLWAPGAPDWIGQENPDWDGNYKVKYWAAEWETILRSYLTTIVSQGFDGVYLDGIDSYEYWSGDAGAAGENETLDTVTAADSMADLVGAIAGFTRSGLGKSSFIICPQNGTGLLRDASASKRASYLASIDAVGAEDVFFYGSLDMDNPYEPQEEVLTDLDTFRSAGKIVLVTDYLSQSSNDSVAMFYTEARESGFIPFAANRNLNELRVNPGFEPDQGFDARFRGGRRIKLKRTRTANPAYSTVKNQNGKS